MISHHAGSSYRDLAEATGLHHNTTREHLNRLIHDGFDTCLAESKEFKGRPRMLYSFATGTDHPDVDPGGRDASRRTARRPGAADEKPARGDPGSPQRPGGASVGRTGHRHARPAPGPGGNRRGKRSGPRPHLSRCFRVVAVFGAHVLPREDTKSSRSTNTAIRGRREIQFIGSDCRYGSERRWLDCWLSAGFDRSGPSPAHERFVIAEGMDPTDTSSNPQRGLACQNRLHVPKRLREIDPSERERLPATEVSASPAV